MESLIEDLRTVLYHKEDQLLLRCLDAVVSMDKRIKELEQIRHTLLDRIDKMTHASLTQGSGKAASVMYRD